ARARKKHGGIVGSIDTVKPTKKERALLKSFAALKNDGIGYIDTGSVEDPKRLFVQLAKTTASKKQQTLFLVPEITLLPELTASLSKYVPRAKIAVLHSKLPDGQYFEVWEKIRDGSADIILSTRQGLFAPFKNLGLVALLEEQDESYKQWDMSPRYDGKRVAERLAALHGAKLLFVSGTPSLESHHRIVEKTCVPITPLSHTPALAGRLEVVNLRLERFKKNYSPLSLALIDAVRETLGQSKQILLYIHRQGMNAFSVCEHCKNIFRCPDSGHALTGSRDGTFRCLGCSYKTGSFPSCPHCGHLSFRHIGFGTDRVERETAKLFPGARIFRADGSTMRTSDSAEQLYEKVSHGGIDILIGTQMILKGPTLPKLALVGMIDADSLLTFPDFRADEKLFQILSRAARQTSIADPSGRLGKVIIQTFHPESSFLRNIMTLGDRFTERMLAERQDLSYPPFSRFVSITCQGKTEAEAQKSAEAIRISLQNLFPKGDPRYRISTPQASRKSHLRKIPGSSLHMRIPAEEPLADTIRILLKKISSACIIDVDPLTLS
ncbi:MAG: primosomal protein N', partial [Candidatus Moraniibacteriota bacterium]